MRKRIIGAAIGMAMLGGGALAGTAFAEPEGEPPADQFWDQDFYNGVPFQVLCVPGGAHGETPNLSNSSYTAMPKAFGAPQVILGCTEVN